jgi:hypothetical protein
VTEPRIPDDEPPARSLSKRALRRLLELDRPVPDLNEEQVAAQTERDYNWNLVVNVGDGAFFLFGAAFLASSTILPLFISKATDSISQIKAAFYSQDLAELALFAPE